VANALRPEIDEKTMTMPSIAKHVQTLREHFKLLPPEHGNTTLTEENTFIVLTAAFFEPLAQSHRCIEQLAQATGVKEHLGGVEVPRSTLSDAMKRFRVDHLRPLVKKLSDRLPALQQANPDLAQITQKIIAGDGSMFRLAGEVVWAIQRVKNKAGKIDSQVRLDLQVDIRRWTIEDFAVSGKADGGEPAVMAKMLQPNVVYLFDRAYYPFEFLGNVLEIGSDFVVRLKKDLTFRPQSSSTLSQKDIEAGVRSDQAGFLGVEDGCKGKAPARLLRLVTVWDQKNQVEIRLLTSLMDVEAWVIGQLYRSRWVIELFLRWLKVTVGFKHLLSESSNGITLQFYVAMVCTMLIHIRTGLPVSKYSLVALGLVAQGRSSYEAQLPILLKRERERQLERARLARKKASKNQKA